MLNRMGVKPTDDGLDSENVAARWSLQPCPPSPVKVAASMSQSAHWAIPAACSAVRFVTLSLGADGDYAVAQGQNGWRVPGRQR